MLVDSHCHLDFEDFAADLDDVVGRARLAGVATMVTICTELSKFGQVLHIAERFCDVFCTVGVHPHAAADEGPASAELLVQAAAHPKVVGIGETGLDFHYDHSPRETQERSFRLHIEAARRTGLPLIVHAREADQEAADILREETTRAGAFRGVMHCFSSGPGLAKAALDLGLYISLSGIVTFKKADELRAIAATVPLDRLLIETDAPYLAPVPYRGKRNEPAFVAVTAARVAELKGISVKELEDRTSDNFFTLFGKARRPLGVAT